MVGMAFSLVAVFETLKKDRLAYPGIIERIHRLGIWLCHHLLM